MTAAERMSYDHQLKLHQNSNPAPQNTTGGEDISFTQKISADAKAGKPGIGKPADITPAAEVKKAPEELIKDAYKEPLKNLGDYINDFETKKNELKEQDEVAKRRSGSMRMIAGISDGLAALANLVGVAGVKGTHSSNQQLQGASAPLAQRLEAARLERKSDIKDISDRLDAYKAQRDALNLQKGTSLAELEIKREEQKAATDAASAKNQIDWLKFMMGEENENQRLVTRLAHEAQQGAANRANDQITATIRSQASGKEPWKFKVDGVEYDFGQANDTQVAEVFNLLPAAIQAQYGKWTGDQYTGSRQNPTKEEMMIAIGMNLDNDEFKKAFQSKYKPAGDKGKSAQDELDNL